PWCTYRASLPENSVLLQRANPYTNNIRENLRNPRDNKNSKIERRNPITGFKPSHQQHPQKSAQSAGQQKIENPKKSSAKIRAIPGTTKTHKSKDLHLALPINTLTLYIQKDRKIPRNTKNKHIPKHHPRKSAQSVGQQKLKNRKTKSYNGLQTLAPTTSAKICAICGTTKNRSKPLIYSS